VPALFWCQHFSGARAFLVSAFLVSAFFWCQSLFGVSTFLVPSPWLTHPAPLHCLEPVLLRKNRPQWLHIHHTPVRSFTASIRSLAYNNPQMLVFPQQPHDPYLGLPSTTNHFKCDIDPPKGARVSPFAWNWLAVYHFGSLVQHPGCVTDRKEARPCLSQADRQLYPLLASVMGS
jgi:hypothetical protein